MAHHLVVVEGAHDAAFFAKLLRRRGFAQVQNLADVPDFWAPLIPNKYPVDPSGRLDRIIVFPDIHVGQGGVDTVAVSVAGSDTNLISTLRTSLEIKAVQDFATLTLISDTDFATDELTRFGALLQRLEALNQDAQAEGQPGFPLTLPGIIGALSAGEPRVGIYLWPGEGQQGTLETILLECAGVTQPVLRQEAEAFVTSVNAKHPPKAAATERSVTPSGTLKAKCGAIASVLKPGGSLAVSLRQSGWLPETSELPADAKRADDYLASLLAVA
jgi:hypothetical protein